MKKIIGFALLIVLNLTAIQARVIEDVSGNYEVKYKKNFFGESSFTLTLHALADGQTEGNIDFYSEELGKCDNFPSAPNSPDYGYVVYYDTDDRLTKLDLGSARRHQIQNTIFCDSGWYILLIEIPVGAFSNGNTESACGFYIQDANFKILVDKKAVMTKLL